MFEVRKEELGGQVHRYTLSESGRALSYAAVLELWQHSEPFRDCFIRLLADSPFRAYRWETPPIDRDTVNRTFGCVLVDDPALNRPPDPEPFAAPLARFPQDEVAVFENLGGDALMVVPAARAAPGACAHLGSFVRSAPRDQVHRLFRQVARATLARLGADPLWLSTAGTGVAWLHVRLDSRPKYYLYRPYTAPPPAAIEECLE